MTLPKSDGTPLVSCQRMRQTHAQRLSAEWAQARGAGPSPGHLIPGSSCPSNRRRASDPAFRAPDGDSRRRCPCREAAGRDDGQQTPLTGWNARAAAAA